MTTADKHTSGGMARDLIVYVCLLALAGIQFVIAYQDISTSQMFVRMLIVAVHRGGPRAFVFHAPFGQSRTTLVCPDFHSRCNAGLAIWMDRRLPPLQWRTMG